MKTVPRGRTEQEYWEEVKNLHELCFGDAEVFLNLLWRLGMWPDIDAGEKWLPSQKLFYAMRLLYVAAKLDQMRDSSKAEITNELADELDFSKGAARKLIKHVQENNIVYD